MAGEDATRVAHVQYWHDLDLVSKTAGKLVIFHELLDMAIKKLKRGKGSPDSCVAEVYHALRPSAREVLLTGLQEHCDTLSFPTEWTVLILKDYRPLASLIAKRNLLGYVWLSCLVVMPRRRSPWCDAAVRFLKSGVAIFSVLNWSSRRPSTRPNILPSGRFFWLWEYLCIMSLP